MKKRSWGFLRKNIYRGFCASLFFSLLFVSAGVNLFAVNSDRGIYYRNDLPGTYISEEEAYAYYEGQYGSGEAEEDRLQYEMLFWNDHGKGRWKALNWGAFQLETLSIPAAERICLSPMLCGLITMILGCVFWETKLHGNCLERFRQKD